MTTINLGLNNATLSYGLPIEESEKKKDAPYRPCICGYHPDLEWSQCPGDLKDPNGWRYCG